MSGMWLSRDFIDYNNLYSYVPSPICEQDVLGLSNETRFMWSGTWYDDEGGSGFGPNSSDIRIGIFDFQYTFTCCDSQSVDGGNLNPENNEKNIETSAYLKMVQYTINNSITEFKGTKCEKAYKFTTSATMISSIKRIFWFTWSELVTLKIKYLYRMYLLSNLNISFRDYVQDAFLLLSDKALDNYIEDILNRSVEVKKVLRINISCNDSKKPNVSYEVLPESTAGARDTNTFSSKIKTSELYIYDEQIKII